MNVLFTCSQALKYPLHATTRYLLGDWMIHGVDLYSPNSLIEKISLIAKASLCLVGMIFSIPLWMMGEICEVCTVQGRNLINDEVELPPRSSEPITLNPHRTKYLGASVSTLEADPRIDILTDEGRKQMLIYLNKTGINTLRFSIERFHLEGSLFNYIEAAKFFYKEGLTLIVTLDHGLKNGSLHCFEENEEEEFLRYAEAVFWGLRQYVHLFITFDEPRVKANPKHILRDLSLSQYWFSTRFLMRKIHIHRRVYDLYQRIEEDYQQQTGGLDHQKRNRKPLQVGLSHQALCLIANSQWNVVARSVAFTMTYCFHDCFLRLAQKEEIKRTLDFVGVQYYGRPLIGRKGWKIVDSISRPTRHFQIPWMVKGIRCRFDPQGVLPIVSSMYSRLRKPLLITETGSTGEINPYVPYAPYSVRKTNKNGLLDNYYTSEGRQFLPFGPHVAWNSILYSREIEKRKESYYQLFLRSISAAQQEIPIEGVVIGTLFDNFERQERYEPNRIFSILARDASTGAVRLTAPFEAIRKTFSSTTHLRWREELAKSPSSWPFSRLS